MDGLKLTFHLAGINNQNFIMRDQETGTYWQQISGAAISGPLAGRKLKLIPSDELTFSLWKTEQPAGTVLKDVMKYAAEYARKDWDVKMKKARTVISYPETGIGQRDVMLGVHAFGAVRAFPYEAVLRERLVQDRMGAEPVVLVVGPDGQSVRGFRARVPGVAVVPDFYRTVEDGRPLIMDSATGSTWNFQGCATEGKARGACLDRINIIKDYWFDWRHYNPDTTIYRVKISDK
jgi:hypothetical protein